MADPCKVLDDGGSVCVGTAEECESIPIKPPLRVLGFQTVEKRSGWWGAVVLLESYAKKQICFYLWQKKGEGWKRKQKFGIRSRKDWTSLKDAVETFLDKIDTGNT